MKELDLTKEEYRKLLKLVESKSVKVGQGIAFREWQSIEKKLLDYLSDEPLPFDGEEE